MPEIKRAEILERYHILGTLPEETFDEIARLAAEVCETPMAMVSFINNDMIWFKSHIGTDVTQIERKYSLCNFTINEGKPLMIPDALVDDRYNHVPVVNANGGVRFYAGAPLITPDGVIIGVLCVADTKPKNITNAQFKSLERLAKLAMHCMETRLEDLDQKQVAQEDLAKQKEFLNAVLENLSDGVIACDGEGQVHLSNEASRRFHGLETSNGPVPNEDWPEHYQLFHSDGERMMELKDVPLYRAFHGEVIKNEEMVVRAVNGKKSKLFCSGRAFFDKDGKKIGAVVTLRDITEERQAVSREQATSMTLKKLIDLVPVGISILDENKNVTTWNKASEEITEWTEKEVLGKSIYTALAGNDKNSNRIATQVDEQNETFSGEMEYITKSGKKIDVQIAVVPIFDGEGKQMGSMGVSVNISDIRTPLNGVMAMSELLSMSGLSEEQHQMINTVQSSAGHLITIVNDILDFSNVEAGRLALDSTQIDLKDLVQQTLRSVEPLAKAKNLKFNSSLPEKMSDSYIGDAGRIRQVILNLLGNAVKFTHKGEISATLSILSSEHGKAMVRFEVTDTGEGIPHAKIDKLFEAFSQVDYSVTRRYGGTGLGLSISQRLVELMKGHIGVESVEGQGSKFWFTIPLGVIEVEVEKAKPSNAAAGLPTMNGVHILIAEDNAVNQLIIQTMVKKLGATCEVVENGKIAIEALRSKKYDLVLMDCQMPEMDGYEATRIIRAHAETGFQNIPIIAVTAHAMSGDREKCLEAGMDEYLTKPLSIKSLAIALNQVFVAMAEGA